MIPKLVRRFVSPPALRALIATTALVATSAGPGIARAGTADPQATPVARAADAGPQGGGYWMYAADGGVFSFGAATFSGAVGNRGADIAGMAALPAGTGYWLADNDGDVFAAGGAPDFGSRAAEDDDIAAFTARPQGDGYWMATRTGSVEAYGSAPDHGGTSVRRSHGIEALAATASGDGYWLAARDGGIFAFGDARFLGSMGAIPLNQPIVGMAATPTGAGYWLVAADGGIFAFGDAPFLGSMGAIPLNQPIVGMAGTPTGAGYWLVAADGGIFAFGDAPFLGSMGAIPLNQPIVGMVSFPVTPGAGPAFSGGLNPVLSGPVLSGPVLSGPVLSGAPAADSGPAGSPGPAGPPLPAAAATLVGAGDIAACNSNGDEATAGLLDGVVAADPAATVFTLGDNVYPSGTSSEFANCYHPTWGRHDARNRPAVGNHEYETPNASGYYGYFGARAGDPSKGWYSYDVGAWHVVVLNSNCSKVGGCGAGSPQEQWLRADLAASAARCTVAYWHHPRFSSGHYGSNLSVGAFWNALDDYGAELVLNGHEHLYERFAPQRPDGRFDAAAGIRQFIVGTGGKTGYAFETVAPNSEVRNAGAPGVMKLTLRADGYDWTFLPVPGRAFTDAGSGTCHDGSSS